MAYEVMNKYTLISAIDEKRTMFGFRSTMDLPVDPLNILTQMHIPISFADIGNRPAYVQPVGKWYAATLNEMLKIKWPFAAAHELIHVWFHPRWMSQPGAKIQRFFEEQANMGAAELLMPPAWVFDVGSQLDWEVRLMAHVFGVSRAAMDIRLRELGYWWRTPQAHKERALPAIR